MVAVQVWCLVPLLLVAACGPAMAEDSGPSCQEQLLVKLTHDQLVVQKRAEVEDQLALVAAQAQVLERKVQLLTKENADLRVKLEKTAGPEKSKE
ncbi:MAG: hypothetical protein Q8N00_00435 [Nitrospirota bacterium]|nr:hypothetical protein [Nitrospirota bacterium]MDP3598954.1 hypothetical protein [Nitrospirota bacterium]